MDKRNFVLFAVGNDAILVEQFVDLFKESIFLDKSCTYHFLDLLCGIVLLILLLVVIDVILDRVVIIG